jgi:hypothetical protein
MIDVIATASKRLLCGRVNDVDSEGNVDANIGVQAAWRTPRAVADTTDEFSRSLGGLERNSNPVDRNAVICGIQTLDFDL